MTLNLNIEATSFEAFFQNFKSEIIQSVEAILAEKGLTSSVSKEYLTPAEVSKEYGKSVPTLNKMVKAGILTKHSFPGIRGVYYNRVQINKVLVSNN